MSKSEQIAMVATIFLWLATLSVAWGIVANKHAEDIGRLQAKVEILEANQ